MLGWIKLHRSIADHWVFQDAEKLKRWIDILLLVNHEGAKVNIGNDLFECNRGQSIRSLQSWAERWKCSKGAARNFLELLEKDQMITLENLTKTTRLTVCKYDTYQDVAHAPKTHGERTVNAPKTHGDLNKKDNNKNNNKELKEIKEDILLPFDSEMFSNAWNIWKEYKATEHKFKYKTAKSEQAALMELAKCAEGDEQTALAIIHKSMAGGWKGFFKLNNNNNGQINQKSNIFGTSLFRQ
jgi:hypothetical protein